MPKPACLVLDTLDDRRQIHDLLSRLSPRRRLAFVRWACSQATLPHSTTHPGVSEKTVRLARLAERDEGADARLALDCFFDCFYLSMHYDFDLDVALARLVELVRHL